MSTVLVTGGNGFLGQHVVKILTQHADDVKTIKVLDMNPFERQLDYKDRKPVESFVGSILDEDFVMKATEDVDCIIHLASLIHVSTLPNVEALKKVNIKGTEMLLKVARRQNIQYFVHCSTVSVVMGYYDIINGTEDLPEPPKYLYGWYSATKHMAEKKVIKANGDTLPCGKTLKTTVVRPSVLYGELDQQCVTSMIRYTADHGGIQFRHTPRDRQSQFVYVGNVAWCFVCAMTTLMSNNGKAEGEAFFGVDDTPVMNVCDFAYNFMKLHGQRFTNFVLPPWLCILFLYVFVFFAKLFRVDSIITLTAFIAFDKNMYLSYDKAKKLLDYKPLYNWEESKSMSSVYYGSKYILNPTNKR